MASEWIVAGVTCAGFAGLEGLFAGRGVAQKIKELRQPRWAPPFWVWIALGVLYYAVCFVALGRLLITGWWEAAWPLVMLLSLMAANALWNLVLFRMKNYTIAFWSVIPYAMILLAFLWTAWPLDRVSAWLFVGYGAYLTYATAWGWRLWRMNRRDPALSTGG